MKRKATTLGPRNGHVASMRLRKAGAHQKSRKAERRAETVALKRMNRDVPERANPSPSAPSATCGSGGMADATVPNTVAERRAGSSPATRTKSRLPPCGSGETVDAAVLKTAAERRAGSSPVARIMIIAPGQECPGTEGGTPGRKGTGL